MPNKEIEGSDEKETTKKEEIPRVEIVQEMKNIEHRIDQKISSIAIDVTILNYFEDILEVNRASNESDEEISEEYGSDTESDRDENEAESSCEEMSLCSDDDSDSGDEFVIDFQDGNFVNDERNSSEEYEVVKEVQVDKSDSEEEIKEEICNNFIEKVKNFEKEGEETVEEDFFTFLESQTEEIQELEGKVLNYGNRKIMIMGAPLSSEFEDSDSDEESCFKSIFRKD